MTQSKKAHSQLSNSLPSRSEDKEKCLGCGHDNYITVGPVGEELFIEVGGREFYQPPYSIHECSRCGLLFRLPRLSEEDFSDYYARKDFHEWEVSGLFPTERTALTLLRSLPPKAKILDFGCSSGRLLDTLGDRHDRYGMELNQEASAVAASKGLKILPADFLETKQEPMFTAIILADVFEHLTTPTPLLGKLVAQLMPDGILIIVTGDGDNRVCRRNPAEFWYFRIIEHVAMITRKYAEWMAGQLGLELQSWRKVRHYDYSWPSTFMQWATQLVYWQFKLGPRPVRALLRMIPRVRNAENRKKPPFWQYSKDHVVAVFCKKRSGHPVANKIR